MFTSSKGTRSNSLMIWGIGLALELEMGLGIGIICIFGFGGLCL